MSAFPNPLESDHPDGLIAISDELDIPLLLDAYQNGIFPWSNEGEPICWYSPIKRMVLYPERLYIAKSMRKVIRDQIFTVSYNQAFPQVIQACKQQHGKHKGGTWITNKLSEQFIRLHDLGYAKSVEIWKDAQLVGGLYGIEVNNIFCGESMFAVESNASKLALIALVQHHPQYQLIDCQVHTNHLESMGAREISREAFFKILHNG